MDKFSELKYERPNVDEVIQSLKNELEVFKNAETFDEADNAFLKRQDITADFSTMSVLATIRSNMNTADEFYKEEVKFFAGAQAQLSVVMKEFNEAFMDSKFKPEFEKLYGIQLFKELEADIKTNGKEILDEKVEELNLQSDYAATAASCKTVFRGEECNFYGLLKHMLSVDREERKEAMNAWADLYESAAPVLEDQYAKLCANRRRQAEKLGFNSYIDMVYLIRHRFDYKAEDVAAFRNAVAEYVTPVAAKLHEAQRQKLGVDKLEYYDEKLYSKDGNSQPVGTTQEKVDAAQKMYSELSPETKEFFDFMVDHDLFDLETRPNKHMGGYTTRLAKYKAPFIFSNFNGTSADLQVLIHEAGHAFMGYTASRCQPISEYTRSTADINEIHSMAMEFFTDKWVDLFFDGNDGDAYRYEHLFESFENLTYLVSVDEFQHRVFEGDQPDAAGLKKIWKETEEKYMPWRSYDGNAFLESGGFWMQKQHIFMYPFYYVDYALAMTCALQFYLRMRKDFNGAWKDYLHLCQLGGSKGYLELLDESHLKNPFKPETIQEVTEGVLEVLAEMEKSK